MVDLIPNCPRAQIVSDRTGNSKKTNVHAKTVGTSLVFLERGILRIRRAWSSIESFIYLYSSLFTVNGSKRK